MSKKKCDNTSVGILVRNGSDDLLLIERKKYPFGFAAPAGHIDDLGSPEAAAREELQEETGLKVISMTPLLENIRMENPCRREGGDHHCWWVYEAKVSGELLPSPDETKQAKYVGSVELDFLKRRSVLYEHGKITEDEWKERPGLEIVWKDLFKQLQII